MTKLLIFASAGAFLHQGIMLANDEQSYRSGSADANSQLHGDLNNNGRAVSHAMQGQYRRASDLMGADVLSQQEEKIGEVKDVMIDLQSGHAPFAVISSGGFFGVGDRLMAVPASVLSQSGEETLRLNIDKQRLQSAPSFERDSWPEMSDPSWSSEIYSYYGQEPIDRSMASSTIYEPAGAERSHSDSSRIPGHSSSTSQAFGETTTGLSRDRTPRQGLGAEDLTKNEQKIRNPGGYAESDAFINRESAGAERTDKSAFVTSSKREGWTRSSSSGADKQMGKVRRASELIGMEVDNAQGERVGEIKDVVLDLQSGRVAYAVLSAGGYLGMGDRLFAVPPAVFTRSTDGNTLVFNTDKETLKAAPSFEKNDWSKADSQQFTTQVYRYYNQPIYWQSSGEVMEPSGSEHRIQRNQNGQNGSSQGWERGQHNSDQGASNPNQNGQINEPSGAAPERQTEPQPREESTPQADQSSAAKETAELDAANPNQESAVDEPAGATTSTAPATSEDQASGDADRMLSQRLRTELKNDSELSGKTENVQVSAANGRLTLRGSVASEQEKQAVEAKAKKLVGSPDKVDNQLRVQTETP